MKLIKVIFTALLVFGFSSVHAEEEKMTYEQYLVELKKEQDREAAAQAQITKLEQDIAALQQEIDATKASVEDLWQQMLQFVGITQEEFDAFAQKLDELLARIQGLEATNMDDLKGWQAGLAQAEADNKELKANKIAIFPRLDPKFNAIDEAIEESKAALAAAKEAARGNDKTYTVRLIPERRDCLWRIAENEEHYGDPWKWPVIYSANKDQIKDPDLIYPGQELIIPAQ